MNKAIFLNSLFLLFTTSVFSQKVPPPRPYGALPNQNQLDWQENNIYAFVHFGLNTFTNKEWGYGDEDPSLFNPKDFDADQIVRSIKQGGFKGIILTCKHHDGFCLWPTKTTEHNITQSPFRNGKGDMVKEVEEACRKYGLKFGVYVSPWDRNSPKYGTEAYVKMYRAQIAELLSNYGSVFEVWHDGANGGDGYYGGARETRNIDRSTYYNWPSIWALEKKLQPQALIFGDIGPDLRWVGTEKGFAGDPCWQTYTPESRIPGKPPTNGTILSKVAINGTRNGKYWMPAEVDFSIRPGWFWHKDENNKVRSATDLWNHYFLSVGHGASMLLNIPPDTDGKIYKTDSINLKEFGDILYKTFSNNLAIGAKITASNVRGKDQKHYGTKFLLDNNQFSYWATDDQVHTPQLLITLPEARTFDIIRLKENTKLGQRIDTLAIDIWQGNQWHFLAGASSIGSNRLIRLANKVTAKRIRLRIIKSPVCIALSDFALFSQPKIMVDKITNNKSNMSKANWQVLNIDNAHLLIDNNENTFWQSKAANFPQEVKIDMGNERTIHSFSYLPRQDGSNVGNIDQYKFYISNDKQHWQEVAEGEFGNIQSNPILQNISIGKPVKARYFCFKILHTADGNKPNIAELSAQ